MATFNAVEASGDSVYEIEFSICTLVTDAFLYANMQDSLRRSGFSDEVCEFLYIDNREISRGDGFSGLNRALNKARGKYVILCHQDIIAIDGPKQLREIINELDRADPSWAVLGNAGVDRDRNQHYFLNEQNTVIVGKPRQAPRQVESLDENFLLVKQESRLGFSYDMSGFHLYGTDIVIQAKIRGFEAYAVDFRVEHLGKGIADATFYDACNQFEEKYARVMRTRKVQTSVSILDLGTLVGKARKTRDRHVERGPDFVRASKSFMKLIRSKTSGHRLRVDGHLFRHPKDVPYAAYRAIRKGYYELPERNLIREFLPRNLPVVELGGSYGIVSGLVNKSLEAGVPYVVVEANPSLLDLCKENTLSTNPSRDLRIFNLAIDYSGAEEIAFVITGGTHDSHVASDSREINSIDQTITVPTTTLNNLLKTEGIDGEYSLICDIEGTEFDLVAQDLKGLSNCACIVVEVHPRVFYDLGRTTQQFAENLTRAGFEILNVDATVVAARRSR